MRRFVVAAVGIFAVGIAAAFVLPWLPVWPCSLFEHFRVHYVVTGALVSAAAVALRMPRAVDIALVATLAHAVLITADLTASPRAVPSAGTPLRILSLNVHTEGTSFAAVRDLIADEHPDVIGLVEVDRRWLAALSESLTGYARIEQPRWDNFGVALYVRGQLVGGADTLGSELPTVMADVTVRAATLTVVVTHPLPPISAAAEDQMRDQFDAIAVRTHGASHPVVVMGDFNATPWSRAFVRFRAQTGLCDSRAGFGIQASFPAASRMLRIPIDHVLVDCSIGVADRRIGRDVGSDHLPVLVDLVR